MNIPYRPIALGLLVLGFSALVLGRAQAGGSHFFAPVANTVVKEECGSCHLAFHPSLLPARSWQRLMTGQAQHFGSDLALDEATRTTLLAFLTANAAEQQQTEAAFKISQSLAPGAEPLRITDTPYWVQKHRAISAAQWRQPSVKSKANCAACHQDAEAGTFEDGAIRLPPP